MHGNNIRRLPVIDNDGKMVGIITDKDILKAAARVSLQLLTYQGNSILKSRSLRYRLSKPD
jgi:CBS-domain-containing membrane protein